MSKEDKYNYLRNKLKNELIGLLAILISIFTLLPAISMISNESEKIVIKVIFTIILVYQAWYVYMLKKYLSKVE